MSILTSTSTLTSTSALTLTFYQPPVRDAMYDGRCIGRYSEQQLLWSITFTYISSSRAENRKAEVKQCQTQALFFVKKKPRSRLPLKWLSYEIALQIHCCRYISFLYVCCFCKIFGDIQHKVDWIQQISINTQFFTLMFCYNGDSFNRFTFGLKKILI